MLFGSRLNKLATSIRRALSEYAVLGINPPFVADFIEKKYLTGGASSTFSSAITHARAGNATMTDGYGPELVVNGGFDSDSDWTKGTGWSISGGKAFSDGTQTTNSQLKQTTTAQAGNVYEITFTVSNRTSGQVRPNWNGVPGTYVSADGTYTQYLVADSDNDEFQIDASSAFIGSIDNVSVREMPVLKWAPHNATAYSEEFDNASWAKTDSSISENTSVAPNGTQTADKLIEGTGSAFKYAVGNGSPLTVTEGMQITISCFVKADERTWCALGISKTSGQPFAGSAFTNRSAYFNLSTGTAGTVGSSLSSSSITDVGDGWYLCSITGTAVASGEIAPFVTIALGDGNASYTGDNSSGIYVWGAHLYRSDLGGMVDNPDRGDSYVPTTSSAKYLPRIGHHVYNGSAWANEGLLAESESRVNLNIYSQAISSWNLVGATGRLAVTDNQAVGPDGTTSLSRIELNDSVGGGKVITQEISYTSNAELTVSCYFKPDEFTTFSIGLQDGENNWARVVFDTSTVSSTQQSVGASSGTVHGYGINDAGNGIYYAWATVSVTDDGDSLADIAFLLTNSATPTFNTFGANTYTGTGGDGAYGGFIQAEEASTPSSYIPTSGQQGDRAAETFTIPSANLPWPPEVLSGVEEVTSGTFDTAAALNDFSTSGTVTYDTATQSARLQSSSQLTQFLDGTDNVAGSYKITWNQTLVSGTRTRLLLRNHPNTLYLSTAYFSGSGEKSIVVTTTDGVMFRINSDNSEALIDNISVQKVEDIATSIAMDGRVTYADTGVVISADGVSGEVVPYSWKIDASNYISAQMDTLTSGATGQLNFIQENNAVLDLTLTSSNHYAPDILVPFDIASRHGSTFINGAVEGVALTADTTPTALPDLSSTDLNLAYDYMGTIGTFRVWDKDLGDAGIVEATNPSLEPSLSLDFIGTGTTSFTVSDWSE